MYSLPPLIVSQNVSADQVLFAGFLPSTQTLSPPTTPNDAPNVSVPNFTTNTSELDRYRVLFLIVGILIGVYVVSR